FAAAGWISVAGASSAIITSPDASSATVNRIAARRPSRYQNMATSTGTASHAVSLSTHAAASATAAQTARHESPAVAASASDSRMNASTGGSVVITARLSAITGEASASPVAVSASRRRSGPRGVPRLVGSAQNAAASTTIVPTASHTPELPASPRRPAAYGRPASAITGRYGL